MRSYALSRERGNCLWRGGARLGDGAARLLASTGHSTDSSQQVCWTFLPDVAAGASQMWQAGLCLSSALSYALPSTGRCRPFPGQDVDPEILTLGSEQG